MPDNISTDQMRLVIASTTSISNTLMKIQCCLTLLVVALTAVVLGESPQSIEKAPIKEVPEFELVVPEPPTVCGAAGERYLCYEIYITNMKDAEFSLKGVRGLANGATVIFETQGMELAASLMRVGKRGAAHEKPAPIARGERVIFFAWIKLPESTTPRRLRHEVRFHSLKTGESFTVTGAETPVRAELRTIAPPLRGENWWVGGGPGNTSHHRRGIITLDGLARIPQRFAIDFTQVDKDERAHAGDANDNASYFCYGKEVLAVADGIISAMKDGIPENQPGRDSRAVKITYETVAGNYVILDLGDGLFVFYAHLQPGRTRVKIGDRVKTGDVLGLVGNSGNSTEPHLHFHLSDRNSPLGCQGQPYAIDRFVLQGVVNPTTTPARIDWFEKPVERTGAIPVEHEIVAFGP